MSDLSSQISSSSSVASNSSGSSAFPQEPYPSSVKDFDEPQSDDEAEELVSNKKKVSPFLKVQSTIKVNKKLITVPYWIF